MGGGGSFGGVLRGLVYLGCENWDRHMYEI